MRTQFGVIKDKTYYKICKPEHFMVMYNGFGISETELKRMEEEEVKEIVIRYEGKKVTIYKSTLQQWLDSTKTFIFLGTDKQRFLSIPEMKKVEDITILKQRMEDRPKMVDTTEYIQQKGKFLSAENVKMSTSKVFIPTTEGEMVPNEKFGGIRLHLTGELDKVEYVFSMSKTNARAVANILGADSSKWIGEQLVLELYRTKTTDGRMVDAINVAKVGEVLTSEEVFVNKK